MSEIKSTLDLVMERTRNLSLSGDELTRQRREEFGKLLQGLMTQYDDGLLSPDNLQKRIDGLRSEYGIQDHKPVMDALLGRVNPEGNNDRLLTLLAQWAPELRNALEAALSRHRQQRASVMEEAEGRLNDNLARNHGISGSALVPNPGGDSACREQMATLREEARKEIQNLAVGE